MSLIWNPSDAAERRASLAAAEARFLKEHAGVDRRERLAAWREWAAKKLIADFPLPADQAARSKLVGQCIAELEHLVRALFDRGWLIEGKRLAQVVTDCLAPIAEAQKSGKVSDFYPYFRAAVRRYVGANAEEIQRAARRDGADSAQAFSSGLAIALGMLREAKGPSLVEVIADRPQDPCKPAARRGRPSKFAAAQDQTAELFKL